MSDRNALRETLTKVVDLPYIDEDIAAAAKEWMAGSEEAGKKLYALCVENGKRDFTGTPFEQAWLDNGKKCPCDCCAAAREVAASPELFT